MAYGKDLSVFEYQKGSSFLHRLSGGVKLAGLLVFSLLAFLPGLIALPCLAAFLFVLALAAGIKPWELLRGSGPLVFLMFVIFALRAFEFQYDEAGGFFRINREGIIEGVIFSLRVALSFCSGALFFRVSTMREIKTTLTRAEVFLHLEKLRLALGLSLMLFFLPKFFSIWEDSNLAWDSRSGRRGPLRIIKILPVIIERLMLKAAETALALEARGAR